MRKQSTIESTSDSSTHIPEVTVTPPAKPRKSFEKRESRVKFVDATNKRTTQAFALPDHFDEKRHSRSLHPNKDPTADSQDTQRKKTAERLRLHHDRFEAIELATVSEKEQILLDAENRKKSKWLETAKEYAAKADVFAAAHIVPKHQVCIVVAAVMIPMSLITITWDLLAAEVFQIPHLSTVNAPAFILFINFIAMPLAMYGYMMEYLMHEHSRLAVIGLICVIIHPMLFLSRAYMEYSYDGFRNEMKLYFENKNNAPEFEYPIGTLDSTTKIQAF